MRCKTCHYPLAKLREHRCPECGRTFDPGDPKTFAHAVGLGRELLEVAAFLGLSMLICAALGLIGWICIVSVAAFSLPMAVW